VKFASKIVGYPYIPVVKRIRIRRLAVTGKPAGPSQYHLLEVPGKEKVMARIERALNKF
jgi:hypothetical protein